MALPWTLNAISLFLATTGALLLFLHLSKTVPAGAFADADALKRHRRLEIAVGLLAAWLVLEDVALILS